MKKTQLKYYFMAFVLIFSGWFNQVHSQTKIGAQLALKLVEKPLLMTDREIYCIDEEILFSAFNVSSSVLRNAGWSNILYIELIAPDGETFVRRKFVYDQTGATGTIRIPKTMLTGNYYLRAYTRWMRDYSPGSYFYKIVKVINPFRAELLEPTGNNIINEAEIAIPLVNSTDLRLKTGKKTYKRREQVELEVSVTDSTDLANKFVVSVIPKGTDVSLVPNLSHLQEQKFSLDFIPETRGLSISGKVVNEADSVPLPFTLVGLTIFNQKQENLNILTNEKGQFFFDLSKLKGEYEIFISAKPNGKQVPLILVDNDFSTQKLDLPYVKIDLSDEPRKLYEHMMFNSQMQALYRNPITEDKVKAFSSDSSFYGSPDFVLKINDFIALPNVKDYIQELMPQVALRQIEKTTSIKVIGPYTELSIFDPLVLVDMVPIFDIDKVLIVQPNKIDRIEVVTKPYVRGDIVFGGIISLFSKKGDLAGIDLPSTGRFISYNMLSSDSSQVIVNHDVKHIPNLRNCLYWNPDLKLNLSEPAKITFETGDNSGDFLIIVSGINQKGQVKVAKAEIKVE